jgi:hypothetical protein
MLELKEKIEAYLTGDLSEAERLSVENAMSSDPSFKADVDFQRDVIDGLKDFRKAQLKARLNNIEVSAGTGNATLFKYAASIFTAASLGAGILYFTSNDKTDSPEVTTPQISINENTSTSEIVNSESNTTSDLAKKDKDKKKKSESSKNESSNTPSTNPSNDLTKPVEEKFNYPSENFTKADDFTSGNADVPNGDIAKGAVKSVKGVDEVKISDKNVKELSYQYFNNELFLFGDFNSRPYELVEYNSNKSPRLFIKFDGAIYELKNNTTKQTPMKEVTDPALLEQLKHVNK